MEYTSQHKDQMIHQWRIEKLETVEDMKSPKEDYEIGKSVVSDPGTGEDLLTFLSFYTLII